MSKDMHSTVSRREFVTLAASAVAVAGAASLGLTDVAFAAEAFPQPALPYPPNALEPTISANTFSFHYGKHTKAYYDNMNKMLETTPRPGMSLEQVIQEAGKEPTGTALFNNAAQSWNHTFFFSVMKPGGGGAPEGKVGDALKAGFGSYENFRKAFTEAAMTQFGSGWAWLIAEGSTLKVIKTANAGTPVANGLKPLLTIDVWEHAYYLDYQNKRADYVAAFLDKLVNWETVAKQLG